MRAACLGAGQAVPRLHEQRQPAFAWKGATRAARRGQMDQQPRAPHAGGTPIISGQDPGIRHGLARSASSAASVLPARGATSSRCVRPSACRRARAARRVTRRVPRRGRRTRAGIGAPIGATAPSDGALSGSSPASSAWSPPGPRATAPSRRAVRARARRSPRRVLASGSINSSMKRTTKIPPDLLIVNRHARPQLRAGSVWLGLRYPAAEVIPALGWSSSPARWGVDLESCPPLSKDGARGHDPMRRFRPAGAVS